MYLFRWSFHQNQVIWWVAAWPEVKRTRLTTTCHTGFELNKTVKDRAPNVANCGAMNLHWQTELGLEQSVQSLTDLEVVFMAELCGGKAAPARARGRQRTHASCVCWAASAQAPCEIKHDGS